MKAKKIGILLILIAQILLVRKVNAKETIHSINKYKEEELEYILRSYDNKGNKDGYIAAGSFIKDLEDKKETTNIMIVKYSPNGKKMWEYNYGKDRIESLYGMAYLYDEEENINGYLIMLSKESDQVESVEIPSFIMLNLEGKKLLETESSLPDNIMISKMTPSINEEDQIDGYLISGSKKENNKQIAFIAKYDLNLNQEWIKTYEEERNTFIKDLIVIRGENTSRYIGIKEYELENNIEYQLIRYTKDLEEETMIKNDFEETDNPKLIETDNNYIVYGITNEVKLKNNKTSSYYIIKYKETDEEEWETIGNTPVPLNSKVELREILNKDNSLKEYVFMYTNDNDESIEVVRVNLDGIVENKIKKITNNYYDINSYILDNNTLYFVGQINCPEDDNCDYDKNSLFLISNEERIIEVRGKDSRNIMLVLGGLILGTFFIGLFKKRNPNL